MKKRHGVLALLASVSAITFVDRLAIAVAGPSVQHDVHLTPVKWGWVLSSYVIANTVFEIPSGALGDRYGQRAELTRIAAWWSIFTALTGWCRTFWQLFMTRFLFGVGAAGAYPNAAGVIPRWITQVELAELGETTGSHRSVPWRKLLALRQLWLIAAAYGFYGWASWFYFSWFPTWIVHGAHISPARMGVVASFPFLLGIGSNLIGGFLSDRLVERYGMRTAYWWVTCTCLAAAAALFVVLGLVHGLVPIAATFTLCFGVMDLMLPAAWAMCLNLGGNFGGTATAVMNTAGNLGGLLCTVVFGYVIRATGNYNLPLFGIAAVVLVSAALFSQVDCTRGLRE